MRKGLLGYALATTGAVLVATATVSTAQTGDRTAQPTGLPDLVMAKIRDVKIHPYYTRAGKAVKKRWAVRFTSQVDNAGPGHFILHMHRAATGKPCAPGNVSTNRCERRTMVADQIVLQPDGTTKVYPKVAVAYFDQPHFHWHTRYANRYELRNATGTRRLKRDTKSGFCFGDRRAITNPRAVEYPELTDGLATCLYGSTTDDSQDGRRALDYTQGISAGYGDDYDSFHDGHPLEGQQFEVTKLKAGRYLLVNRTNAQGRFVEASRKNNVSSVLFRLSWPKGKKRKPAIKILRNCPGKALCRR